MRARSIAFGALVSIVGVAPVFAQAYGAPATGERLAAETCAQCHSGVGGSGGAPAFVTIASMPSTTEQSLTAFLQTPHASMPDLIISPEDRSDLVAYILSLRP
jgi:mono/diheme cytochrome c family protein